MQHKPIFEHEIIAACVEIIKQSDSKYKDYLALQLKNTVENSRKNFENAYGMYVETLMKLNAIEMEKHRLTPERRHEILNK